MEIPRPLHPDSCHALKSLAQRSDEIYQAIQTLARFRSQGTDRRFWNRRVLTDRRDLKLSGTIKTPMEQRSRQRRCQEDQRLPPEVRLRLLRQELTKVLHYQIALMENPLREE